MNDYTHLTRKERYRIYALLDMGKTEDQIAEKIQRHRSTIYRETSRNLEEEEYYPIVAQQKAEARRRGIRSCKLQRDAALYDYVVRHLRMGWSPEQISGRMRLEGKGYYICPESIYRYIYREKNKGLYRYLHYKKPRRRMRHDRNPRACRYGNIRLITNRPKEVEGREKFGHWEGDSIVFNTNRKKSVVTLIERKSRAVSIIKNENIHSEVVMEGIKNTFMHMPKKAFLTATFDQGSEFADYRKIEGATGCRVFYCEVRSPWQRGSNENMNGRLRRYLPLYTDIESVRQKQLDKLAEKINNTPRKCLGFRTPREIYLKHCSHFNGLQL